MKKIALLLLMSFVSIPIIAQKKPTIMILPSDNWCTQRYFVQSYDNQGVKVTESDYVRAFKEDTELTAVISKLGGIFTDMGYSLKDAEMETKTISSRIAERNATYSSKSGAEIQVSSLDEIKMHAKMDILIQIWWNIIPEEKGNSVTFTIEAFDAYTSKRIATSTGTSKPSKEIIPIVLEKTIKTRIPEFDKQLTGYYNDVLTNGREIILNINIWDNWDKNLESEYNDGEELIDCIQKWLKQNTVNKQYNLSSATETMACFEQVRIPAISAECDEIDARFFANSLRKYLRTTYHIESKVMTRGLGEANLILGEK